MWHTVLEAQPSRRGYGYVIGIVNAPIGPCINLVRVIRIHDDRVDRDIRKIASLIHPRERSAVSSAAHLKHVARLSRRVSIEPAYRSVAYGQIRCGHGGVERDTLHGTKR